MAHILAGKILAVAVAVLLALALAGPLRAGEAPPDPGRLLYLRDCAVWHMIAEQRPAMPHFRATVSEPDARAIVEYLKRSTK